jgi:hypothetical protein
VLGAVSAGSVASASAAIHARVAHMINAGTRHGLTASLPLASSATPARIRTNAVRPTVVISDLLQDPRIRTDPFYDGVSVALGRNVPVRSGGHAPIDLREIFEQSRPVTALTRLYSLLGLGARRLS